jgi:hypothetical protein
VVDGRGRNPGMVYLLLQKLKHVLHELYRWVWSKIAQEKAARLLYEWEVWLPGRVGIDSMSSPTLLYLLSSTHFLWSPS